MTPAIERLLAPQSSRRLLGAVGGGLRAIANLATTLAGAPSARLSTASGAPESAPARKSPAADRSRAYLAILRDRRDATLAALRERRESELAAVRRQSAERRDAIAEAADTRRARLDGLRADEIASRTAARQAAAARQAQPKTSARRSQPATFTWVNPENGRRYNVSRPAWDKSSHSLFQIIVDDTRPEPDRRGYPSADEWRRHCNDVYSGRDRRESYIIRNLPSSPRGLEYLEKLK